MIEQIDLHNLHRVEKFFKERKLLSYYYSKAAFYSHFCKGIYASFFFGNEIFIRKYNTNPRIFLLEQPSNQLKSHLLSLLPKSIKVILQREKEKINEPEFIFSNKELFEDLETPKFKESSNNEKLMDCQM